MVLEAERINTKGVTSQIIYLIRWLGKDGIEERIFARRLLARY